MTAPTKAELKAKDTAALAAYRAMLAAEEKRKEGM